ncbi:hydroxymethylglutaryl-CoA reductase, degradative [Gemella sp. zg-1178]|uniref:hydroxymethylglutaryl-CoA reductase, degradative n=1 Tax=Gemella sp. zg-1178 TaxID=2840372 RepID=UPI001C059E5C|nr:hydroxymethylglutaryl-CoA reductase, degradative [Gemella sp. zg-1178]MBU0279261.1 hydroxymethylglutaryl-CoA reductase, degradative [Gemella sp. zg-1178]
MTFTGFYKKTRKERIEILKNLNLISDEHSHELLENITLDVDVAGNMTENHIATFALPFGIVPQILVNNKEYSLPMVTEEPSVVAAASNASKIIAKSGGFETKILDRKMIGQIALYDVENFEQATSKIEENNLYLLQIANEAHPSIVKRGGGACDISWKILEDDEVKFLVVYLTVDVKEAMGANILNNMLEAIKPYLENLTNSYALMAILSNYATKSLVTASCKIKIQHIDKDIEKAKEIAKKIELASKFAKLDPYRAATHNKGIFNGIDALVIASGNDWRAVEAACHTYATRNGTYEGLSTWIFNKNENILSGEITLPMPIASVGGSIGLNNSVKISHEILGNPDAKTLASLITALGLAQNFAALKALVSVGIQQGHMKLHAKSLALLAGAKAEEVEIIAEKLQESKHMNLETAKLLIKENKEKIK